MLNPNPPMQLSDLQQRLPTQNRWENLEEMYNECSKMFGELLVYPIKARELETFANESERKELQRILRNLHKDSEAMLEQLNQIRTTHVDDQQRPLKGIIYDTLTGEDLFQYTSIGVSYRNWMDSFQALVTQPLADFVAISEMIQKRNTNPSS